MPSTDTYVVEATVVRYFPERGYGFARGDHMQIFFRLEKHRKVKLQGRYGDRVFTDEMVEEAPVQGQKYLMRVTRTDKGFRALAWGSIPDWKDRLVHFGIRDYVDGEVMFEQRGEENDFFVGTLVGGKVTRESLILHIRQDGGPRNSPHRRAPNAKVITRTVSLAWAKYDVIYDDVINGGGFSLVSFDPFYRVSLRYPITQDVW